jgi:hypothetical protein
VMVHEQSWLGIAIIMNVPLGHMCRYSGSIANCRRKQQQPKFYLTERHGTEIYIFTTVALSITTKGNGKGKVFPLQAWTGPWGSGRLRLPDFYDFRHYEAGKVVTLTHRPSLPPGVSWYSFLEAESTPGHMVLSAATEKIPSDTTGDRSRDPPTSSSVIDQK